MKRLIKQMWNEDDGVLSFEWVLLTTLLTLGVVAGIAGARDAIIDEMGDAAQAMLALDQSYTIDFPLQVAVHAEGMNGGSNSSFTDAAAYGDCLRAGFPEGQGDEIDLDS